MTKTENYLFYIVEDHPEVAQNNCIFLKKVYPSAFCLVLETPDKLLERLTLEIPSLVVLDLQFGNIKGIQSVVPTLKILNTLFLEYPTLNILIYSSEHSYLHPYISQISNHQGGFSVVSKMQRRQFFLDGAKNDLKGLLTL
ncbi:MAG: DNA-binding response regulator, partial [Geminocystis sp. GBBB08]|nr:DNA-binding response regulator [Geminocystis sp. GBBB08]